MLTGTEQPWSSTAFLLLDFESAGSSQYLSLSTRSQGSVLGAEDGVDVPGDVGDDEFFP